MKKSLIVIMSMFALSAFAADLPVKPAEKTNCVTKDKKGNCPEAPKSAKPTPKKKIEHKEADAKK